MATSKRPRERERERRDGEKEEKKRDGWLKIDGESWRAEGRAQVTQLSPWKPIEGSCGFEPPKVLLEHRLF